MIDRAALLATLKPLVLELEDSIRERALDTREVAEHLEQEHQRAVAAERTAMSLEEWRDGEITQAAVAWVLGCVFVRFLEDNGLIDQALISGPGGRRAVALGHREEHFRAHPSHSDREYLEDCVREVAEYPAVAPLYDERHNPLWRLGPTADGARSLRETFTAIEPASGALVHDFTDPEFDTRFLGDLYQDLSEAAKRRYALLQTPEFVERFILDRTLDPAIDEFGLDEVRLIDPTCGSGHFLIGAFERLFRAWQAREPATTATMLAQRCLDQIAGVDLNPYATAIARFRLVVVALRACRITRLAESPALRFHLATGDSLLHGPLPSDGAPMLFDANRLSLNIAHVFDTEDASELKDILGRNYHAVVGNPPYIAVEDEALREAYRRRYHSCYRGFAMTVPFMERFFELARPPQGEGRAHAGFVGKITGNNFMKREFGAPLVEKFLPSVDVQVLIDASGAYIPGHGTPTVLLFGRGRAPVGSTVRVVEGLRGEPRQPIDPAAGLVWTAITNCVDEAGAETLYVRTSDIDRMDLASHPLILGAGRVLKARLEDTSSSVLSDLITDVGYTGQTNIDEVMLRPTSCWARSGISENLTMSLVVGDGVRDWHADTTTAAWFPYAGEKLLAEEEVGPSLQGMWPWRTPAWERRTFNKTSYREEGRPYYEWHQISLRRHRTPFAITWGEVTSHNHFVLGRAGCVFNRTAPIIKLADAATEDEHLALLAVLNSSTACFWLKQVCQDKGVGGIGGGIGDEAWEPRYAFNGTNLKDVPLPRLPSPDLSRRLDALATDRAGLLDLDPSVSLGMSLAEHLGGLRERDDTLTAEMISLQEELDWQALVSYGLASEDLGLHDWEAPPISLGQRAFEIVLARQAKDGDVETTWFERHGSVPITEVPTDWPDKYRDLIARRIALIESDSDVGLVERAEHKRRWNRAPWEDRERDALAALVLDALEDPARWAELRLYSTNELTDELRRSPLLVEALELLAGPQDSDPAATLRRLVLDASVPHLAAQRLTDSGLRKRDIWERVWDLQRVEDRGERITRIPNPPKYAQADFRSGVFWRYRGKLDVPKERFVLVPNAERGADTSAVVGWAGWNERDLARALAGRITELRQEHAADAGQLVPLLAGVLELLPWIHQWHPDSDPLFGGPPGTFFEGWLDGELASLGVTREALRAWRPPTPTRGRKATASTT
jgi:hypothetical protein